VTLPSARWSLGVWLRNSPTVFPARDRVWAGPWRTSIGPLPDPCRRSPGDRASTYGGGTTATQLQRLAVCSLRLRTGQIVVYYQLIQDVKLTLLGQGEVAQGVVGGRCLRMARQHGGRRPVEAVRGQPEVTSRRSYVTLVAVAVVHHV
jgi:hypothetical protein